MLSSAEKYDIQIDVSAGCCFYCFVIGFKLFLAINLLLLVTRKELLCRSHLEFIILACSMELDLQELNQRWYIFSTKF